MPLAGTAPDVVTRGKDIMIHPTAIIEEGAQLGADCQIHAHAIITRHAILGDRVVVHPFAVVGGDPQYLKFDSSTVSKVRIGAGTVLREYVTVNRAIYPDKETRVGENCFLMAGAHVAHDCELGNNVILANNVLLAGHVHVGDCAFVGGGAAIHQNVRIGESVMISGVARITRDLAHYTIVSERDRVSGLNSLGLKRRGFTSTTLAELRRLFRLIYFGGGNPRTKAQAALAAGQATSPEARKFLEFFTEGKRGFARAGKQAKGEEQEA